jgi:hypothetical protein
MQIMRFLLAIAAAPFALAATLSLAQAPPHMVNSKMFTGHDKPSEFIGATDELVFLTRNARVKGGLVGVLECYRRQDLELVCQLPLNLPVNDADEYVRVGGLLVKEAPAIIYTYNKKGKGRAVDLAVLDPSTGEVSSHVNLMTMPGGSDQTVGEVRFGRDVHTGQVVVLAQKGRRRWHPVQQLVPGGGGRCRWPGERPLGDQARRRGLRRSEGDGVLGGWTGRGVWA